MYYASRGYLDSEERIAKVHTEVRMIRRRSNDTNS